MSQDQHLNFARKLRPKTFDQLIGQETIVKMLRNALFLGRLFPVYLFFGQRGCGKTSTARIFAAALNCKNFDSFKKKPQGTALPCATCEACKDTASGSHPDFIEMDAASHTGVDHMRTILESSSYLPVSGRYKIYLIDEAHMLSKAAFNALLKVLEEPPAQAIFILATTEVHKIPSTVRSRSFQGLFKNPSIHELANYFCDVAKNHNIKLSNDAAKFIAERGDRCVRDGLNLLEQVSNAAHDQEVTPTIVRSALGLAHEQIFFDLVDAVITKDCEKIITTLKEADAPTIDPGYIWSSLLEVFRAVAQCNISPGKQHDERVVQLASKTNYHAIRGLISRLWVAEQAFGTISHKYLFIEHTLLDLCHEPINPPSSDPAKNSNTRPMASTQERRTPTQPRQETHAPADKDHPKKPHRQNSQEPSIKNAETSPPSDPWKGFLHDLQKKERIVFGILHHAKATLDQNNLSIELSRLNSFIQEQLDAHQDRWHDLLKTSYGIENLLIKIVTPSSNTAAPPQTAAPANPLPEVRREVYSKKKSPQDPKLDFSDETTWPKAHLITKYFPGRITECRQ